VHGRFLAPLAPLAPLAMLALAGCADRIAAPNTDLGLTVWAEVSPTSISVRDTTSVLRIRVYAGNPSVEEIRIRSGGPPYTSTGDPSQSKGLASSFRIGTPDNLLNAGPNTDWFGDSVYVFPPLRVQYEEKTITLAEWRRGGWPLVPGSYRVRSWFNAREGRDATLTLTP
jgi:hypothetical protein